ncbi:MAG: 16S rRNA (cytosine(967)-C(5))-methyltransferase [Proteobacteria bacterium]|nr:MAG: 16S rRNA (cytosine(967)-C(5))-methyltransferase [Pseudomonadota bacterium]
MNTRAVAARTLQKVIYQGESLTAVLQHKTVLALALPDRAWVQNACFGTVRWHGRLGAVLHELLSKQLKAADKDLECLLRLGLYQLIYQRTPDHAAVNETVQAVRGLKKPWASKLVNGVLRGFLRNQDSILAKIDDLPTARYSFPPWLEKSLRAAWPTHWGAIMQASNEHPPMVLRVNARKLSREAYLQQLQKVDISAQAIELAATGIVLAEPVPVNSLPDFEQGAVSVQDAAAQQAASLLHCEAGQRVLDACAAPGGKTCHLLERYSGIDLLALDSSAERLKQVTDNLQRLDLRANVQAADAADLDSWWDGVLFDRILLDAPCSATGVIRRHPDIKLLRKQKDIVALQQEQAKLLRKLWQVLQAGGYLLYATCSILPAENNDQVEAFLREYADAVDQPINVAWGRALSVGRQILPGEMGMDGFYYALLKKAGSEGV